MLTSYRRLDVPRWLAYLCLLLVYGRRPTILRTVNYTGRCLGCGCYEGEPDAGLDHHGWDCHFVTVPWWEPLRAWWRNLYDRIAS